VSERKRRKTRGAGGRGQARDLTRAKVVSVALSLIDADGADAISMRGLADAVGVTPMSLYNHFSNKRDLLSSIAASVVGNAQFDGGQKGWRAQLEHCFGVLRDLCLRHPGLPRLLEFEGVAPASIFAPMEVTLGALRKAGLDDIGSLRTYFLLMGFTLAQAAYQTRPIPALELSEDVRTRRIAGRGYTTTERIELPSNWDFDAAFSFGITLILNGVEATVAQSRKRKTVRREKE
jgi:TetR/AcrR family transcriptional regulator, tetracycline repressor protein